MRVLRAVFFLIVLVHAGGAIAQPLVIGEPFPLTNTRYAQRIHPDEPPSFGAVDQNIVATASSRQVVLTVWSEQVGSDVFYRAGIFTVLGQWKEIALPGGEPVAAAAGTDRFVIVMRKGVQTTALRFTFALDPILPDTPITGMQPMAIGWNGTNFAIIGTAKESVSSPDILVGRLMSPGGELGAQTTLFSANIAYEDIAIASDGNGFLVSWKTRLPSGGAYSLRAMRLQFNLATLDPTSIIVAGSEREVENGGGSAWDGATYVVTWKDREGSHARQITPGGVLFFEIDLPSSTPSDGVIRATNRPSVAGINGGSAIVWRETNEDRLRIIRGNNVSSIITFVHGGGAVSAPHILPFGSGIAYTVATVRTEEPYDGAARVSMTIGDVTLPPKADPPHLSIALVGGRVDLTWTAPPQQTNGYRVEMRIGNGKWTEIEQWFPVSGPRFLSMTVEAPTARLSFRVRAWNNAGVSAYSNVVTAFGGRRRAVR